MAHCNTGYRAHQCCMSVWGEFWAFKQRGCQQGHFRNSSMKRCLGYVFTPWTGHGEALSSFPALPLDLPYPFKPITSLTLNVLDRGQKSNWITIMDRKFTQKGPRDLKTARSWGEAACACKKKKERHGNVSIYTLSSGF